MTFFVRSQLRSAALKGLKYEVEHYTNALEAVLKIE